jgi:hypothetical protein
MKTPKISLLALATLSAISTFAIAPSANAITYDVSRSWTDGTFTASLFGTVDVPLGNYTITNGGPSPFTSVNLTMILNGTTSALLSQANTSLIYGTGQFFIFSTASSLIFDAANGDAYNPADLVFKDAANLARYGIGSDGIPSFEAGYNPFFSPSTTVLASVALPNAFGTAASSVPDAGSTLTMLGVSLLGLALGCNRLARASTKLPVTCTSE